MRRNACLGLVLGAFVVVAAACDDEPDVFPDGGPMCSASDVMSSFPAASNTCADCMCGSCTNETLACLDSDGCFEDVGCVFDAIADGTCDQEDTTCLIQTCSPDSPGIGLLTCVSEDCDGACSSDPMDAGTEDAGTEDAGTDGGPADAAADN